MVPVAGMKGMTIAGTSTEPLSVPWHPAGFAFFNEGR